MASVFNTLTACLAVACATSNMAHATVVDEDISNLVGFQRSGVGGIFGNGIVFASPIYAAAGSETLDFGIATVRADPPDGREGPCPTNCEGNAGSGVYFLHYGVGGIVQGCPG